MTKIKHLLKRAAYGLSILAVAVAPILSGSQSSAAPITAAHKVVIGDSAPSAVTTYAFTFQVPTTGTIVKSASFVPCTTASGACSTPAGWSGTGATSSQPSSAGLGDTTGWTTTDSTSTELRLSKSGNAATPTATPVTITFSAVTNPSALNSTFFLRMTTFSGATFTGSLDTGVVASSTAGLITVNATVDETLTFTLAAATVTLAPSSITTAAASFGTSSMSASTNAANGYTITYSSPNALKPAGGTALPSYSSAASVPGTAGFGINLKANTTPAVGSNVSGAGSGTASGVYNTADSFTFVGSNVATQVASASVPTNSNTYTVSYVANIAALTAPGAYTTTFTYVATPNF